MKQRMEQNGSKLVRAIKILFRDIDMREMMIFFAITTLIGIIIILFHYSSIQRQVKKLSRCYIEKQQATTQGTYMATAQSDTTPVYKVSYNFPSRQQTLECACPPGDVLNEFQNIPYFDLKTKTSTKVQQYCQCDAAYDNNQLTYTGYPSVIQYMYNPDDTTFQTFFKRNLI